MEPDEASLAHSKGIAWFELPAIAKENTLTFLSDTRRGTEGGVESGVGDALRHRMSAVKY